MQFVHISDNHLGYKQYNSDKREEDFYEAFKQCIDKILEIKPDFVIHSGDLFEKSTPSINALYIAMDGFEKLIKNNIPIYIIQGNHDLPTRASNSSPFLILKKMLKDKLYTFGKNKYHIFSKNGKEVFIGGSDYVGINRTEKLFEIYGNIEKQSKNYKYRLLLFHQNISSYSSIPNEELQAVNLPKDFNYYAGGHIHQRILKEINLKSTKDDSCNQVIGWSGSTEINAYNEYENYLKEGKGFYLIDLNNDFSIDNVEKIDIKCREFIICKGNNNIKNKNELDDLKQLIQKFSNSKPVVICEILNTLYNDEIKEFLNNNTLYSKIKLYSEYELTENIKNLNYKTEELFKEYLENKKYNVDLVENIFKNGIKGEDALKEYIFEYYNINHN